MNAYVQKCLDHCIGCRYLVVDYYMPHRGTYPYFCNIYKIGNRAPISNLCNSKQK